MYSVYNKITEVAFRETSVLIGMLKALPALKEFDFGH